MDKAQVQKYAIYGLGAVVATIIVRRLMAPKITQDQPMGTAEAPKVGLTLLTSDFTPSQATSFRNALPERAKKYADLMVESGRTYGVSPLVLAGIMKTETGYGDACKDVVCRGFTKHDFGLMQINDLAHPAFFQKMVGGVPAYQIPRENIMYAGSVLKQTMAFFNKPNTSGLYEVSARSGLKYGCVPGKRRDPRPLTGEQRLVAGIAGYNAGQGNAIQALACGLSADAATHNGRYVASALGEAKRLLAIMEQGGVV